MQEGQKPTRVIGPQVPSEPSHDTLRPCKQTVVSSHDCRDEAKTSLTCQKVSQADHKQSVPGH